MHALPRLLMASGVVLGAAGVALAVMPTDGHVDPLPVSLAPLPASLPGNAAVADSLAEEIVLANVFAGDRTPPATRYTPPELAGGGDPPDMAAAPPGGEAPSMSGALEPLLFGTIVRDTGSLALLQFDHASAGPRLYRAGDREGSWRVVSIAPREVVLAGPAGRLVLRLPTPEDRP